MATCWRASAMRRSERFITIRSLDELDSVVLIPRAFAGVFVHLGVCLKMGYKWQVEWKTIL